MKLAPDIHIVMHSVLSLKPGVTARRQATHANTLGYFHSGPCARVVGFLARVPRRGPSSASGGVGVAVLTEPEGKRSAEDTGANVVQLISCESEHIALSMNGSWIYHLYNK